MKRVHPLKQFYDIIDTGEPQEKLARLPDFPRIIELEITNHCNFQCVMCKTGTGLAKRPRGFMTEQNFELLVSELEGKSCGLKFVGQGESTLHPEFLKFVKRAKQMGLVCHLTTNGSMFKEEFMRELVDSGLDSVKFSFQGVTAEGYRMLRKKNDFDELLKKIRMLYEIRGEGEAPYITIGTSVTNESKEEIESFREKCTPICDKLEVGITTMEFIDLSIIKDKKIRAFFENMKEQQAKQMRRYKCCHQVFDVITIHWDGTICACCADNDEVMTLGSLSDTTIEDCWKSPKEEHYRKILVQRDYEKLQLCKDCYDIYGWTYQEN